MYEDTNNDGKYTPGTDEQIMLYYDETIDATLACYGLLNDDGDGCIGEDTNENGLLDAGEDINGNNVLDTSKELKKVHYLWSAAEWLSNVTTTDENRPSHIMNIANDAMGRGRYIFTWNDLDNDGIVDDATEILPFESSENLGAKGVSGGRGPVTLDFNVDTSAEVNTIIDWIRGDADAAGAYRSRQRNYSFDPAWDWVSNPTPTEITWRLGDVVHSTPMVVARPIEALHLIYDDFSYAEFAAHYNKRRHVIYFGANDGMLHAVNGGFYDSANTRLCLTEDCRIEDSEGALTAATENVPELGAELWAYVPYNLLPHLGCLMDKTYNHKYYVDSRPRIFDMQIFADDADHPNGWGTILVAGMRFGGAPVDMSALDVDGVAGADYPDDPRELISAYMIFDITNPEAKPDLLGEMTSVGGQADMGYTTSIPTAVTMYDDSGTPTATADDTSYWYLILGSGPTNLDGTSDQQANLAVYPIQRLVGASPTPFRIPNSTPLDADSFVGSYSDWMENTAGDGTFDRATCFTVGEAGLNTITNDEWTLTVNYCAGVNWVGIKSTDGDRVGGDSSGELCGPDNACKCFATDPAHTQVPNPLWHNLGFSLDNSAGCWNGTWTCGDTITFKTHTETVPENAGIFTLSDANSFISDLITVDFEIADEGTVDDYMSDAVYFGTISGNYHLAGSSWGGKMYRLVTREMNMLINEQVITEPYEWSGLTASNPAVLVDAGQPIVSAASVGIGGGDFWVYFGTGRFIHAKDKSDLSSNDIQTYYGIKEPRAGTLFTWGSVDKTVDLVDVSGITVSANANPVDALLDCTDAPGGVCPDSNNADNFQLLSQHIDSKDGWIRDFSRSRERNLGQATLLGGLLLYTTYVPYLDECLPEGLSYLYGVYYKTGTAFYKGVFEDAATGDTVEDTVYLGRGMTTTPNIMTTVDDHEGGGSKAFIQTSTGAIKEIDQPNLPLGHVKTGRKDWLELE